MNEVKGEEVIVEIVVTDVSNAVALVTEFNINAVVEIKLTVSTEVLSIELVGKIVTAVVSGEAIAKVLVETVVK